MDIILSAVVAALVAAVAGFFAGRSVVEGRLRRARATAEDEASRIVTQARAEAENLRKAEILAGKEEAFRAKEEWEREEARRRDACRLLDEPELEIRRIAELLGYADPANFTRAFKSWTGRAPREWRAEQVRVEAGGSAREQDKESAR